MIFAEYFMGERVGKRNKIILSLAIAVFVVLSLIVSLVVVFAEENEILRNVNAACKVYNADCHVSASYTFADETKDFTVSGLEEGDKFLTFDKTEATQNIFQEKMLKPTNDIVLTKENNTVVFEFKFANFDFDAVKITVALKQNENVNVEYSKNGISWIGDNARINLAGTEGVSSQEMSYFVKVSLVEGVQSFDFNQDISITIHN